VDVVVVVPSVVVVVVVPSVVVVVVVASVVVVVVVASVVVVVVNVPTVVVVGATSKRQGKFLTSPLYVPGDVGLVGQTQPASLQNWPM
jgi:hypothetical protein